MTAAILLAALAIAAPTRAPRQPPPDACNVDFGRAARGDPLRHGYLVCGTWMGAFRWQQAGDCRVVCPAPPWMADVAGAQ